MKTKVTTIVTSLVAMLTVVGLSEWAGYLQIILEFIPDFVQGITILVTAAAGLASALPGNTANKIMQKVKEILNSVGFNFGAAKNKEESE